LVGRQLNRFGDLATQGVVIYGTGSPIVVDVEESLSRAGLRVLAAVHTTTLGLIVRDDGSTDETVSLLKAPPARRDSGV
jgi:hypothetical protein